MFTPGVKIWIAGLFRVVLIDSRVEPGHSIWSQKSNYVEHKSIMGPH